MLGEYGQSVRLPVLTIPIQFWIGLRYVGVAPKFTFLKLICFLKQH